MALHSAGVRPDQEQSDGYIRRIRARVQKLERYLAEVAKIVIGDNVRRAQQEKRLELVEQAVDMVTHDLAGVDDRINDMAAQLESLRNRLKLGD